MSSLQVDVSDALYHEISRLTDLQIHGITPRSRDEIHRAFTINLEGGSQIEAHLSGVSVWRNMFSSHAATIQYISEKTSIPVPSILALDVDAPSPLGPHLLLLHPAGQNLETLFPKLSDMQQDAVVTQIARWTLELLNNEHDISAIGNIYCDQDSSGVYTIGPLVQLPWLTEGRNHLNLDRGPFTTARAYLLACAQREKDSSTMLFTQEGPDSYQQNIKQCRLQVEQTVTLLVDLISRCKGLDADDPTLAAFALDIHGMNLRNFIVSSEDPSQIICVTGWEYTSSRPFWQCARLPLWLNESLRDQESDVDKARLAAVFRHVISAEGSNSSLLSALNGDDTRCALHDLCDYDAFKDGFLLNPTLQSISATLPGEEDIVGLSAILDPNTVTGRVARISLLTSGSAGDTLSLAFLGEQRSSKPKDHQAA